MSDVVSAALSVAQTHRQELVMALTGEEPAQNPSDGLLEAFTALCQTDAMQDFLTAIRQEAS